ncbi:MAG: 4Fe-4S dicluster domain-containing protein [Desulfobacterales bacterium]|nr:4Fe-4S dicluster domain-containing protein [Desulfobacterales bacterium]
MDNYEKFREILHRHPSGAPQSGAFDEILRILFTPEEVAVALGMVFVPRSVQEIAKIVGVSEDEVLDRCESMANKGIVFSREKDGEMGYALLPTIPGMFEFPFMTGGGTPMHDRLGKLWMEYHHEALGREFTGSRTPLTRVIPIEQTLDLSLEVLPYEVISAMLDRATSFGLSQCACRVSVAACDKPRDVCLTFDRLAKFLVERNLAQEITREEAQATLTRAEETGLVHTTNNSQDRLNFLCNCCTCCCTVLRGLTQLKNPNAFARSRWNAQVNSELCTGCGVCEEERCPMGAIEVVEDVARVDIERCIGCGLCATACDTEAISMVPREYTPETPRTISEMGLTVATEKGRREEFLKLITR